MAQVVTALLTVAGIILIGFLAARVFQTTRFPDIPLLLLLGILAGPVNRLAAQAGWGSSYVADHLSAEALRPAAPYLSAVALIVILFDSGLRLDFQAFRRSMGPAVGHTLPVFILTIATIAFVGWAVFGMSPLVATVLGVALSNVGQTVSAAVIRQMRIKEEVRSMYFVEMALYDLMSIPIMISMLAFAAAGGVGVDTAAVGIRSFAVLMAVSVILGGAVGLAWILALERLRGQPLGYMLTFAVLLALYSGNQLLGGSGAVSVLLFGLVVGNREAILPLMGRPRPDTRDEERILGFHEEITFFVRTAYFLFLGLTFSTGAAGGWNVTARLPKLDAFNGTGALFALGVVLVFIALVGSRYLSVRYLSAAKDAARRALFPVFGRGLGTAVLATLPFIHLSYRPGTPYHDLFSPWEGVFTNTALLIILGTVLTSAVLVWRFERRPTMEETPA